MNDKVINELVHYISLATDIATIQTRLDEYDQAIKWAEQQQRWDLVLILIESLLPHFAHAQPKNLNITPDQNEFSEAGKNFLGIEGQGTDQVSVTMRALWEKGREFARQGLLAAQKSSQDKQFFLTKLAQLSDYLGDFEVALDYFSQLLRLANEDARRRIIMEINLLADQATSSGNYLVARACYQKRLEVLQQLGNPYAMAETLAFMAANETIRVEEGVKQGKEFGQELLLAIELLWDLRDAFLQEHKLAQASTLDRAEGLGHNKLDEVSTHSTYERLQAVLIKLNSST